MISTWETNHSSRGRGAGFVADLSLCSFRVSDGAAGRKACSPYWTRRGVDRQASGHREETQFNA